MIITLCGSVRFEQEFIDAQRELSRRGVLCFSLAVLPVHRGTDEGWADGQIDKTMADLLYFNRILHSDAILVLGNGYVGASTAREILWAKIQGKKIFKSTPDWDNLAAAFYGDVDDSGWLVKQAREVFK